MKFKNIIENRTNKVKIKLLQDLTPLLFRLSHLRKAKNIGDIEVINMTQLGSLNYQQIKYEKINEEEGIGSDSGPAESSFTDSDIAKSGGDRIGSKKKEATKMFKKRGINWEGK
jgi:hypothetical protein